MSATSAGQTEKNSVEMELEEELKTLIVESLSLEDVTADQIVSGEPLFGDGLGLDSIDALELAMVISKRYGIKFESSDEENKTIFASVSSLAAHIAEKR